MEISKILDKTKLKTPTRAVIREVRKNQFNESKKDIVTDIGIARGISDRELEELVPRFGEQNIEQTWIDQAIFIHGEPYKSKMWGMQTKWVVKPATVVEEKVQ